MEGFYMKNYSKVTGDGSVSSINLPNDHQLLLNRPRYGSTSFASSPFDSRTPDPLEMESALMHYPLTAAAAATVVPSPIDAFSSPVIDSSKFHPRLMQKYHHSSNFSSRSSSPSPLPLSIIDNLETPPSRSPPLFTTPVKVEEDVLVMDGILVGSVPGGRSRSSSDSGSLSPGNNLYKTEICRSWEETGSCRYGTKCQFAHGKEELRPGRYINKNSKSELCKSWSTGTSTHSTKSRLPRHVTASVASASPPQGMKKSTMKFKQEERSAAVDWSPADDGIKIRLPSSTEEPADRETVDSYIRGVLHGSSRRRRLPVFAEICPE
ncbi:zinc finger protein zfs1-like [Telopea speciosissima]|uniref:zinc finger protein zfs1-like n=1 Tax=Telopea speciosissima TaxID=54955 RepID=UPI001CC6449A|nr:zinc finger protein zfs1-like [Telopea speciosissima]XP_043719243.1 zinc finger protein zfs1-like [Telopea speciosissima]